MEAQSNAILVQSIEVSPGLRILRMVPDGWEQPDFVPGQFAVLGLPGLAKRCDVCDPEEMVEILETEGYREHTKKEPGQIHVERYW